MPSRTFRLLVRRFRTPLWVFGGFVIVFLLANYLLLPMYVNHGGRLSVPSVIGIPLEEAKRTLEGAALIPVEAETRPDPTHPAGVVIYQNPPGERVVKEGRHVYLTISGGEVLVVVPSLRGRSLRDARFALERVGLKLGGVGRAMSDLFPANTVIEQSVGADVRMTKGGSVSITLSTGVDSGEVLVPTLVGKTVAEAEKILAAIGLRVGNITYQPSFDLIPNTVVDQYPRGGEPGKQGQVIDLFVVKVGRPTEEIQESRKP
jgi:serine/threonine-protein kinase